MHFAHIDSHTFVLLCIVTAAVLIIVLTFGWEAVTNYRRREVVEHDRLLNNRLARSQEIEAHIGTIQRTVASFGEPTLDEAEALNRASNHAVNRIHDIT